MPINVSNYRQVLGTGDKQKVTGRTINLSKSGDLLVVGGNSYYGRTVSWFKGFRAKQHTEVRKNFINSLTAHYGKNIARQVANDWNLDHSSHLKKALTDYEVFYAFKAADQYKSQRDAGTAMVAARYTVSVNSDKDHSNPTESKLSEVLSKRSADTNDASGINATDIHDSIDLVSLGKEIQKKIIDTGNNEKRIVREPEAENIAATAITNTVERHIQAEKTVADLKISDKQLEKQVIAHVARSNMSPSQVKSTWNAGIKLQPHLAKIAAAKDEESLKKALRTYTDTVHDLEAEDKTAGSSSVESRKQRSLLMMMAQGKDQARIMEGLHSKITQPGIMNSYMRAMNTYRLCFPDTAAYKNKESFYKPSVQKADEFYNWAEALGFTLAEQLDEAGDEAEVLAAVGVEESLSGIDDRTLNLMRNTGIQVTAPDRTNQQGEGTFCDAALKYIEAEQANIKARGLQDGINKQFLLDTDRNAICSFNGEVSEREEVKDKLRAFCTDEDGTLNEDMLYGLTQFHQGTFGGMFQILGLYPQWNPIGGGFTNGSSLSTTFQFNKNADNSISVVAEHKVIEPSAFVLKSEHIELDSEKSEFELKAEYLLTADQFNADRDRFPPPKLINATYKYGMYTKDE